MASQTSQTASLGATAAPKQIFLEVYEREHQTTLRVLRAFPADKLELRPHPRSKTARELAWTFVVERVLGIMVFTDAFASHPPPPSPPPPQSWEELIAALEGAHREFAELIRATPDQKLNETVKFFVAPQTLGDVRRLDWIWFLLHDEIHHRGQFSVYLRMADGKVPSIYGPTADEPWM